MKPKALYRYRLTGGPEPNLWAEKPVFGIRRVCLLSVKREVLQVLVSSIGGLAWINVNQRDLIPLKGQ